MSEQVVIIAVVCMVLAVAVAAYFVVGRRGGGDSPSEKRAAYLASLPPGALPPPLVDYDGAPMRPDEVTAKTTAVVRQKLLAGGMSEADARDIGDVVGRTVETYWSGTRADYRRVLDERGLSYAPGDDDDGSEATWVASIMLVRGQPVKLDGIDVAVRVRKGTPVIDQSPPNFYAATTSNTVGTRRGKNDVADPLAAGTSVVRC